MSLPLKVEEFRCEENVNDLPEQEQSLPGKTKLSCRFSMLIIRLHDVNYTTNGQTSWTAFMCGKNT